MSWQEDMVLMVRVMIDDLAADPEDNKFSDDRIQQSLVIAGILVSSEYPLSHVYSFSLSDPPTMSPDPTENGDSEAVALLTLRASCIANINQFQKGVRQGIRVRDGSSAVDTTSGFGGYKDVIMLGPCASYQSLKQELLVQKSMNAGKAIGTPISHIDFAQGFVPAFFDSFCTRHP